MSKLLTELYKTREDGEYSLDKALAFISKATNRKFDESVDVSFNLNVDPKYQDQQLRGTVKLPHGSGKTIRVAVFAKGELAEQAKKAGAEHVGADDLYEKVKAGFLDFEICIAAPDMMPTVGKLGKVLGPKGLMPNPKIGTVTKDVGNAVTAFKSGQVEYKVDKFGIVHGMVGKKSFPIESLKENFLSLYESIKVAKPSGVKGAYIKSIYINTTMGCSLKLSLANIQ
jgi:large subunit ribosomal protein L1